MAMRKFLDEIIIPCHLPDETVITEWLTDKKEKKIVLTIPSRGTKNALLDMAIANARSLWETGQKKEEQKTAALHILQEKLSLEKLPQRIECYDISNISGKHAVGSMVVFQDGEPDKSSYRRFRIKDGHGSGRLCHDVRGAVAPVCAWRKSAGFSCC